MLLNTQITYYRTDNFIMQKINTIFRTKSRNFSWMTVKHCINLYCAMFLAKEDTIKIRGSENG